MTSPVWLEWMDAWSAWMRASAMPESTIYLRRNHIGRVAREVGSSPTAVTTDELLHWLASQPWKPNTRRSFRSSLRAFYRWAIDTNRIDRSPAHALPRVRVPRGRPHPPPEDAYLHALSAADRRVLLALLLTGSCGLRRGEAARARREDVEPALIGWALRVVGKGGHVRLVPLADDVAHLILAAQPGWLFPSRESGHLTAGHLGKIISRSLPHGFSTHSLRHRAGTQHLRASGGNLRATQEFLGHAKPETTAIYTQIEEYEVRKAVEAITPPFDQ